MIDKELVTIALDDNFTHVIRMSGLQYFRGGMVEIIEHSDTHVLAEVKGPHGDFFEVSWEVVNDADSIWLEPTCDCPKEDFCNHQAAVLYQLLMKTQPTKRRGRRKKVEVIEADWRSNDRGKRFGLFRLDGKRAGEYRRLPLEEFTPAMIIEKSGPRHRSFLEWNESFRGKLISETEFEIVTYSEYENRYRNRYRELKMRLRKDDDGIFIKCLTCNKNTPVLCEHQQKIFQAVRGPLEEAGFFHPEFKLSMILDDAAKSLQVDREAFHKYFEIQLVDSGIIAHPIKDNIYSSDWINRVHRIFDMEQLLREERLTKIEQSLSEGRRQKVAYLWAKNYQDHGDVLLCFMEGNSMKTKEGLHSTNREILETPDNFPKSQKELANQFLNACQELDTLKKHDNLRTMIADNIEGLNEVYQYVTMEEFRFGLPKLRASELHLVKFDSRMLSCSFSIERKDGLVHITRKVMAGRDPFNYNKVRYTNPVFCATTERAHLYPHSQFESFMRLFPNADSIVLPFTTKEDFTRLVAGFRKYFKVDVEEGLIMEEETVTELRYQILLREVGEFIVFEPRLSTPDGEYSFNAFDEDSYHIDDKIYRPDESDRHFLINFLKSSHPDFEETVQMDGFIFLDIRAMMNNYWFLHFNDACEAAGIELLGQKNLTKFKYSKLRPQTSSYVKSGIDWFEVSMEVSFGKEKVKTADWIRALRNNESFVTLKDGSLGVLPEEWLEQARKIVAVADLENGELRISKYRFNVIEDLFDKLDDQKILEELRQKKERLANYSTDKKHQIPDIIQADLRPYQEHGFAWLKFLDESGFGGILADDMGLGKTLQVIALLADQIDEAPSLVVVPRSLLFNWGAEIDKFCPTLTYIIHHGPGRSKALEALFPCNVIITTYDTAASDIQMLKDFHFNYIILDESQAIKNPESKRYKAMRLLQSRNKITMTGTPIENNTFDLYAQLSFSSPGLLGTKTHFKNNFAIPIDNQGNTEAANLLRKLIHPFVLRRTKEQVASDLPKKTETIIYCEMGPAQRKLYENLKRKVKEDIEEEVEEKGFAKSKFKILDGLLRLRQMCNSPLLLNSSFKGSNAQSVKIDILLQNLTEELDQHNALVFSQFVSLLSIVRKALDERGIKYAYLDGSTTKRQKEVDRFMNDKDIKIFLISLKAGNTGLNLVKADYVYIIDPWWNPAVEAQAIDRTHRIGQDKQIFAYKLICKDSIEEKILQLQIKKKKLAQDIIRTDENIMKSLDKSSLMSLFD
ncbi:MAG: SNF2-related protein [Bacteroidota bacterium]